MTAGISGYTSSFKFKRIEFDWPRWHDPMNSNWDRLDSILNTYIASNGITGDWANSTEYLVADKVFDSVEGNLYICKVAHTSAGSGSFVDDIAAHPSYWAPYNFVPVPNGEWQTSTAYDAGAFVYLGAIFAYCVVPHTSDVFADDITAGYWAILIDADATVTSAEDAKNAAAASASSAAASESAALAYKVAAAVSETNAAASSSVASTSATNASASASAAHTSAEEASSAKAAAELARDEAEGYAVAADNTPTAILSKLKSISVPFGAIRNRHLNPAFQICQDRATEATVSMSATGYVMDGVLTIVYGGGVLSCSQVAKATPGGSPYRLRAAVSTTDEAINSTDAYDITIPIEGVDVADLQFGTISAKSFVWRGIVNLPTGTYGLSFTNGLGTRSYVTTITVAAGEAGTDKLVSVTIPGDTSGSWISDASGPGLIVRICIAAGTNYQTASSNSWQTGNLRTTAAQTNGMVSTSNVFEVADIGLYAGSELPTWEMPAYADDLRHALRYYGMVYFSAAESAGSMQAIGAGFYPVLPRVTPSVSWTPSYTQNVLSFSAEPQSTGFRGLLTATATGLSQWAGTVTYNARL